DARRDDRPLPSPPVAQHGEHVAARHELLEQRGGNEHQTRAEHRGPPRAEAARLVAEPSARDESERRQTNARGAKEKTRHEETRSRSIVVEPHVAPRPLVDSTNTNRRGAEQSR